MVLTSTITLHPNKPARVWALTYEWEDTEDGTHGKQTENTEYGLIENGAVLAGFLFGPVYGAAAAQADQSVALVFRYRPDWQ